MFAVLRSAMVNVFCIEKTCKAAEPRFRTLSNDAFRRRSGGLCVSVNVLPMLDALPIPVKAVPPAQKRYEPFKEFHNTTPAPPSSCRLTSKTETLKLQVAVFDVASVAVHVTMATPGAKLEPDGGAHTTVTPGQLSEAVVV